MIVSAYLAVPVQYNLKGNLFLGKKLLHSSTLFFDVNQQDLKWFIPVTLFEAFERRQLLLTPVSPRGKKTKEHRLTAELAETNFLAVKITQGKIRCRSLELRRA